MRALIHNLIQVTGLWLINQISVKWGYERVKDIPYGNHPRNQLDYYQRTASRNKTEDTNTPLVLFFYGGNWRWGSKAYYQFIANGLCQKGYDVVIPDYRLHPHVLFDGIREDAINACRWAIEKAGDRPLIVMGHSAGAQLGALLTLDKSLLGSDPVSDSAIKAFIGLAGPYDFYPFSEAFHYELFGPEENYPSSQPVNFVRPDAPPLYLLHGTDDQRVRRGHSKSLLEKQLAVGGEARREVYEGMGHAGVILAFAPLLRNRSKVLEDVVRFIHTVTHIDS